MIIFVLAWHLSATAQRYLQTYATTNIATGWLSTRRGFKWAVPAALLATLLYAGRSSTSSSTVVVAKSRLAAVPRGD